MNELSVLLETRKLLQDPNNWTQQDFAKNQKGIGVPPASDDAVRWCVLGAMRKVQGKDYVIPLAGCTSRLFLNASGRQLSNTGVYMTPSLLNDESTHTQIMKYLETAISQLLNDRKLLLNTAEALS